MPARRTRFPYPLLLLAALLALALACPAPDAAAGPILDKLRERRAERSTPGSTTPGNTTSGNATTNRQDGAAARRGSAPLDPATIVPGSRRLAETYGPHPAQSMDVYLPPNPQHAPVIVMVHGGAWKIGDKANPGLMDNKLARWLPKGFVLVSINYRMLPNAMALTQAEDVAAAVRRVADAAPGWGADPSRIILMGHSAGAHLVALVSSTPSLLDRPVAGTVVLDSAAMDVPAIMQRRHLGFYDEAFGKNPSYWIKASPQQQWTTSAVPMLLVCSTKRADKPCTAAEAFAAKTARAGRKTPVLPQALTHGEINHQLGLPGAYTDAVDGFITARLEEAAR
ncbi:alpha/beta hydrolase [Nitratidesulfovibrio sp.]|uniref:alpha/beta hydrolase n=1 Tax=Nitratidesulfovibrio sp. TaxID=2802297 RepID=UPI0033415B2B